MLTKDGSWNSMISAHPTGQIFVDLMISPYCSMGEESIINPFIAKIEDETWAYTP